MSTQKPSNVNSNSIIALTSSIEELTVSNPRSFLDLPHEIRNKIYTYFTHKDTTLPTALTLSHIHLTTSTEYPPLYLASTTIPLRFLDTSHFLKAFYPPTLPPLPPLSACTILADDTQPVPDIYHPFASWNKRRTVNGNNQHVSNLDMSCPATTLQHYPGVSIPFPLDKERFLNNAVSLRALLTHIMSGEGWRTRLADFSGVTLRPRKGMTRKS
ncbi:hypothetical protein G6011_06746 [Alternaria panax]|uniref:Uncharacterized protein n=1 Tax=Alternaria panax TaxID=48097 RepID=A0AAD4FH33_9PLEO|nr:hypothetical protein G6011_06746 [Alternaria panax]